LATAGYDEDEELDRNGGCALYVAVWRGPAVAEEGRLIGAEAADGVVG
jgi:hypothetical protein